MEPLVMKVITNYRTAMYQNYERSMVPENNAIYGIIYTGQGSTGSSGLDVSAGDELNTIINSIKINDNVTNNNKVMGWAELIMPTIGGDWG